VSHFPANPLLDDAPPNSQFGVPIITCSTVGLLHQRELWEATGAILLVDKPQTWTSFDVVAKTRGMLKIKKVGHTGTLDPMATGLLAICLGKATRLADHIQAEEKEYTGTILFGAETDSDDADGTVTHTFPTAHLTEPLIREAAGRMIGEQLQTPPSFSARKIGGQRMYKLARKGVAVQAPPRSITVREFQITGVNLPETEFRIVCSKGTYIRALARDLGRGLESGAHLTALRRTRSGSFLVGDALAMEELLAQLTQSQAEPALTPNPSPDSLR